MLTPSFARSLPSWTGGAAIAGLILLTEGLRYFENFTAIPFLLIIVVISLCSSLKGIQSGLISASIGITYLIYVFVFPFDVDVVPNSFLQVVLEILAIVLLVILQGNKKLNGDRITQTLRQTCDQLYSRVDRRTRQLDEANISLREQIRDREISEARLLLALEASQMGIWDWDMITGQITWSSGHEQLFGLAPNTFDGRYETFDDRLHPDDRTTLNQAVEKAIRDRTTYHCEYRVIWKNGSVHWIAGRGKAFYDEFGKPIRMTGTVIDIDERKQMEIVLQRSRQRYQTLTEASPVGIFHTDAIGNCLYVNDRWSEIAGVSISEAMREGWVSALYAGDRQRIFEEWYRSAQEHRPFQQNYRFQRPDGTITWVYGQAVAERNSIGEIVGYVGTITDITELKATETQLRFALQREQFAYLEAQTARQQVTSILESVTDGFVALDANWHYTYVNRKAGEMLDRRPEDLIGKHIWEEFPEGIGQKFYHVYHRAMLEQMVIQLEDYYPPWDRWFENRIYPSSDGLVVFFQDTTDRKQIELALRQSHALLEARVEERTKALRESQALLEAVIQNSPAVIYLVDTKGKILLVNQQHDRVFNRSQKDFIGKTIDEVFPPDLAATFNRCNQAVLEAGHPIESEEEVLYADGLVHTALSVRFPIFDDQGVPQMVCGICTDITERAEIARLKDEFVSIVSHELRTPLTSIYGALNLLSEGLIEPGSEWEQRTIKIAAEGADRLVRLVNDILDLERLKSGKISLSIQFCDLAEIMTDSIDQMQMLADQAEVFLFVSPLPVQIDADRDRLIQVLTNLLSNAIKFSPTGEQVDLIAQVEDQSVLVQVRDRGRGIAADQLEKIFDRFHQLDVSDARQKGGTGLGLAICRSIVEQHGGQIWAESTIGIGTCFVFRIPLHFLQGV
ncbi:PAS domain S-box protein [Leptolyngbya sp. AN03gr2]|uniref:PAS domain S-box protein n=1 Tax=unclassified Leptolyngbya TaxID=2650499 RepID=UPI003D310924